MTCPKCARELPEDAALCCYCGRKIIYKKPQRRRPNGAGTVYKRGSTYTASLMVGKKKNEKGKIVNDIRTKGGFLTRREALEYIPELRKTKILKLLTWWELYDLWKSAYESSVKHCTFLCYQAANKYFKPIHSMVFANIGIDELQDCVDSSGQGKRTKQNMRCMASLLYKYALPRHQSDMNYAQFIDIGDDAQRVRSSFPSETIELIRKNIGIVPGADIIYCFIYTGFRPNEMLELQASNYDPKLDAFIGGFKSEAGTDRPVPISPKIAQLVRARVRAANPYIFPREDGKRMTDEYFRKNVFYPALAAMGIQPIPEIGVPPKYVPYSCRHTFADLIKNADGPDKDKAALMGHADFSQTKAYQSSDLETRRSIIAQL